MDGDWEQITAKPKKSTKPKVEENKPQYGGKGANGKLVAGPIKNGQMAKVSEYATMNQASAIADFDYHIDDDRYEEAKFETVSHVCAQAVAEARTKMMPKMTQGQLAAAIGQKPAVVVAIENGTGQYVAGQINAIEKALNVKIPRGRGKKGGKK